MPGPRHTHCSCPSLPSTLHRTFVRTYRYRYRHSTGASAHACVHLSSESVSNRNGLPTSASATARAESVLRADASRSIGWEKYDDEIGLDRKAISKRWRETGKRDARCANYRVTLLLVQDLLPMDFPFFCRPPQTTILTSGLQGLHCMLDQSILLMTVKLSTPKLRTYVASVQLSQSRSLGFT